MSVIELVLKNMRQRALSTWLTLLSVVLGVGLATAVLILYRGGSVLFGQTEFGYDILMGPPKGSPLQLVMNTVYLIDQSPGVLPYAVYEDLLRNRANVKIAVPYAVGDSYKNHRIIGTLPKLFGFDDDGKPLEPERVLEYKQGLRYEIARGRVFGARKFEALIGADVTDRTGLKMGDALQATHGLPQPGDKPDEHDVRWSVVGVLKGTNTAADRAIFIPLTSFYAITEHGDALRQQAALRGKIDPSTKPQGTDHDHDPEELPYRLANDGTIELLLPKSDWQVSAVLVRSRGGPSALGLIYNYKVIDNRAVAVNPAMVMREFFDTFFRGSTLVLLLVALLVSIVASVGILVSIYNSVAARSREIATLRALGATRGRILLLICVEAILIGLCGGIVGMALGHGLGAAGSIYLDRLLGQGFVWYAVGPEELLYLAIVVLIAGAAGLAPALKAYRVPVATNLVAA
ncbi:MAG: ABC transporter permease [Tepidisphaeraceae bacterium]